MAIDLTKFGIAKSNIDVQISYRIIQLFSEGLYSSPHKAIEELISNGFDAGALNVQVNIPIDLNDPTSKIIVIDDGIGMDETGLRQHWRIGVSNKRNRLYKPPKNRKQIGKFGIGKLATYVLANRFTHISKVGEKYYATTMDYRELPSGDDGGIYTKETVTLPLRQLTAKEAKELINSFLDDNESNSPFKLFGRGAPDNWTIAILSDLKPMATDIQIGRLNWILRNAMPLRDDFKLFLNDQEIVSKKINAKKVGRWTLGKELKQLPKPAPDNLKSLENKKQKKTEINYFNLVHPQLGSIYGYVEVFDDLLTGGTSDNIERSHGFFIYVRGRLININDEYFGIDSNLLRHGTFSRFRAVVHIDMLDDELRSSRETIREGTLIKIAQNILQGIFNFSRTKLEEHQSKETDSAQVARRIAASPASLSQLPIINLLETTLQGKTSPLYLQIPDKLSEKEKKGLISSLRERTGSEDFVTKTQVIDLPDNTKIAIYNVSDGILYINSLHPFVAYFRDEYENQKRNLPLELLVWSEIILEASLYQQGISEKQIHDIISSRDELLRNLARTKGKRNAYMVAQDLIDASNDQNKLENELIAAFDSMGFDTIPKGGPGKPDGIAKADLSADSDGVKKRFSISLEAKSKQKAGTKVSAKSVNVSGIARQRDSFNCDHAIIVGPDFPTQRGDQSALVKEIETDHIKSNNTITLIRVIDLAKLVRLVPLKRISLNKIRELLLKCRTPEESHEWVEAVAVEQVTRQSYQDILEVIGEEQSATPSEIVEYSALTTALRLKRTINISKNEVIQICRALSRMAPEYVFARENSVEITQRPDKILEAISSTILQYPKSEQVNKLDEKLPILSKTGRRTKREKR